jgi:hypothetical protein
MGRVAALPHPVDLGVKKLNAVKDAATPKKTVERMRARGSHLRIVLRRIRASPSP